MRWQVRNSLHTHLKLVMSTEEWTVSLGSRVSVRVRYLSDLRGVVGLWMTNHSGSLTASDLIPGYLGKVPEVSLNFGLCQQLLPTSLTSTHPTFLMFMSLSAAHANHSPLLQHTLRMMFCDDIGPGRQSTETRLPLRRGIEALRH